MEQEKFKLLSSFIFVILLSLIFIRPILSGLAYPVFEFWYEIFAIILAMGVIAINALRREFKIVPYSRCIVKYKYILLFLLAYAISTITSINIHNSIKETLKLISCISIFFIISQENENQKNTLIKTIILSAVIISLYSIYQYFFGYQHTIDYLKRTGNNILLNSSYAKDVLLAKRAIGTFPSPNIFGGYLIIIFFIALLHNSNNIVRANLATASGWTSRELFKLLPCFIIASALILTKSLGAWLSLIACIIILFLLLYNSLRNKKILIIASTLSIIFILLFIILNRWERLINLENPQNSITQRLNYWRTSIAIIKDHPFLGVGPGNFQEVFLKYKVGLSTDTRYAHNIFLHIWAETGFLGFLGAVFLVFTFISKSILKSRYIFLAGLAFLLHNLIDITYFIPETGLFFWILLGFANNDQSK